MNAFFKKIVAATILAVVSSVCLAYGEAPLGWTLNTIYTTSNVKVYQKIGSETYAQVIDMVAGAKIEPKQLYVQQVKSTNGNFYKGYSTKSVADWYGLSANPVSVVNGDYFGTNTVPASKLAMLSFGVRANGSLVDPGAAPINDKQIEFFTGQGASITSANATRLANGPAQNIVGGYSPANAISKTTSLGRTGFCTLVPTTPSRLVLLISARSATQSQIDQDFVSWNCVFGSNQIMMDGSASAQLSMKNSFNMTGVNGDNQVGRTVPQVIVIRNNGSRLSPLQEGLRTFFFYPFIQIGTTMKISRIHIILISISVVVLILWYISHPTPPSPAIVSSDTGLVTDLANPFGSGGNGKTLFDTIPTQPIWETSSGATVYFNTNWIGRTLDIQGKSVHYQFGSGNPMETDRTNATMLDMQRYCANTTDPKCQIEQLSDKEIVGTSMNNEVWTPTDNPSRVTPELERLLYEFLSNPIIRQSSESCGNRFFTYGQAYSVFGSAIGETQPQDWWNPYLIDINTYITINTDTGRKEFNMMPMFTIRHQLNSPSELVGGTWWTNVPLRECLEKNNQLSLLLNHVNLYTVKLQQEYRSGK